MRVCNLSSDLNTTVFCGDYSVVEKDELGWEETTDKGSYKTLLTILEEITMIIIREETMEMVEGSQIKIIFHKQN